MRDIKLIRIEEQMRQSGLVNDKGQTYEQFIGEYKPGDYERPSVTVDMLLFTVMSKIKDDFKKLPEKQLKIMLIKRKDHPYIGQWAIPGGFVDINESVEDAVYRELKEETNIDNVYLEQLYLWGDVNRDPRMRVISSSYIALVPNKDLNPIAGDDAEAVQWFTVKRTDIIESSDKVEWYLELVSDEESVVIRYKVVESYKRNGVVRDVNISLSSMSDDKLAFDHSNIIVKALDRLRNKIEYSPVAFNLVDEYFTLTELQQVYEVILGRSLIKPNFRRKIAPMVVETDKVSAEGGYRPSKLYKFNSNWTHQF